MRRVSANSAENLPDQLELTWHAVEFATVGQTEDGKIYHRLWSADEITALLKEHDLAKSEDAEEK